MGGRLSVPKGPAGTTESSQLSAQSAPSNPLRQRFRLNSRTIIAPASILVLASLFFVYSRTTINAAKENARRHRNADGGSISWRNEALRRHGALEKPEERTLLQELFRKSRDAEVKEGDEEKRVAPVRKEVNFIEEGIRRARDRRGGGGGGGRGGEGGGLNE